MEENCQAFTNKCIEIIKNQVPQREVTIRLNDKMWFNSNINKYKQERNHVNNLKKDAKEQFYFSVNTLLDDFSSSNSKSYWSLINKLVKSSGDMSPISQ